jgi:hypothetical protein
MFSRTVAATSAKRVVKSDQISSFFSPLEG